MNATFQDEIAASTPRLQELVGRVLELACDGPIEINDICARMGLSRKLAWQTRRFAYSTDPFRAATLLPSPSGIQTIVSSARAAGIDAEILTQLAEMAEAHDQIVQRHAGDRATLNVLASNCAAEPDAAQESQLRELSFQGNSFIWGIRARVLLSLGIFMPSPQKPHWFDYVQVRGLYGLQRMRPHSRWTFNQSVMLNDDMTSLESHRQPLDQKAAAACKGVPVLAAHCTSPLPLERRRTAGGLWQDEIIPGPIGQLGEEQIVTAEVTRELAPQYATPDNAVAFFGVSVRMPIQTLILDHIVHEQVFEGIERTVCVFNEVTDQYTTDELDLLPIRASVARMGRARTSSRCPEVPGYAELLRDIGRRLGQPLDDFILYRTRIEFPPMPTSVMIRHHLPGPPA